MPDTAGEGAVPRPAVSADVARLHDRGPTQGSSGDTNGRRARRSVQLPTPAQPGALQNDLDRVSLTQALLDTEAATVRVIDLTERLVDARRQIVELRGDLEQLRIEYEQYRADQERVRSSRAFKLAERVWAIRNVLGI